MYYEEKMSNMVMGFEMNFVQVVLVSIIKIEYTIFTRYPSQINTRDLNPCRSYC